MIAPVIFSNNRNRRYSYTFLLLQITNEVNTGIFVKDKGSYPNELHCNFAGSFASEILRNNIHIYGTNSFVTMYVTMILLEAFQVNNGPVPTDDQLYLALESLGPYYDKNRPLGSGAVTYWPQAYNSTINRWYCYPSNFMKTVDIMAKISEVVQGMIHDVDLENLLEYIRNRDMMLVF